MTVLTGWPPLKRIIVGIESTWKAGRGLLVLIHVELHDAQVLALGGDLLEHGGDDAAGTAPGSPEVDEHGLLGLDDLGLEVGVGDFGEGACHGNLLSNVCRLAAGGARSPSSDYLHYTK